MVKSIYGQGFAYARGGRRKTKNLVKTRAKDYRQKGYGG
jgi:hypothetical protein